jgi:NAD(P)H-nitrite reductase large subunit
MKRIVILGSSVAGAKIIEEIRRNDSSSEITIIAFDGHYPYKRDAFASFISKEITPENVFYRSKDFYEQYGRQ